MQDGCELCLSDGGTPLWRNRELRIVAVADADYPGFCRVVWNTHVAEMTDLEPAQQARLMRAVFVTEGVLRRLLRPDKVNLASLGNQTPHLHWHVIPRWRDDRHFPAPIWAEPRRSGSPRSAVARETLAAALRIELGDSTTAMSA